MQGWMRSAGLALFLFPLAAQAGGQGLPATDEVRVLPKIVKDCRKASDRDEITVCGTAERSPYRLPEMPRRFDPNGDMESVSRERHRLFEVGETGIGSCSNVGPGAPFGCTFKLWKEEEQQKQGHDRKPD